MRKAFTETRCAICVSCVGDCTSAPCPLGESQKGLDCVDQDAASSTSPLRENLSRAMWTAPDFGGSFRLHANICKTCVRRPCMMCPPCRQTSSRCTSCYHKSQKKCLNRKGELAVRRIRPSLSSKKAFQAELFSDSSVRCPPLVLSLVTGGTVPIGSTGTPTREVELQPERKKLLPLDWKRFRAEEIKELAMERTIPIGGPTASPRSRGVDSRPAALVRDTDRNGNRTVRGVCSGRAGRRDGRVGTEQSKFPETSTGSDRRRCLHDSDGSKTLNSIFAVLGSSRGRTTRRFLSRTWEPGGGWCQQEVETSNPELKDKLPREQPMASGPKRRWESGARQFLAMTALELGTHFACGWSRIRQHWDVIELFSKDAHVSLAVSSPGGRATQLSLMMAVLVTF